MSAAILLAVAVLAIGLGHPWFDLLVAVFAALMGWEWAAICSLVPGRQEAQRMPARPVLAWQAREHVPALSLAICILVAAFAGLGVAGGLGFLVLVAMPASLLVAPKRQGAPLWFATGVFYIALPCLALLSLRNDHADGAGIVFWILALTVSTDTLAYVAGKQIGGPKLAPRISPNKTWAGFGGAIVGAALAGALSWLWLESVGLWKIIALSAVLGAVEQGGDLVESAFKRHFGVKDSSQIIPGHGGVLDRVDGLLAVAVVVAAIIFIGEASFLHAT